MAEYTYKGIIIDPNSEEVKNVIGKEVYFEAKPFLCLKAANEKLASNLGILVEVCKDSINPFCVKGKSGSYRYPCIIEKKEEPKPEYSEFESQEEFIEAFYYHDNDKYSETDDILLNYGMWLKSIEYDYGLVTRITDNAIKVGNSSLNWTYLLDHYTFLDGLPCGKLKEAEHE